MVMAIGPLVGRGHVYAALSRALLYPTAGLTELLTRGDLAEAVGDALMVVPYGSELQADWQQVLAELAELTDGGGPGLEEEYRSLFDGQTPLCPPYETEYTGAHVWMQTQQMADIAGFYRAFGVDAQETGERSDSLAVELEFVYLLYMKEAIARDEGNVEGAEICQEAREKFVGEHLKLWLPRLNARMQKVGAQGFYPSLLRFVERLVALDAAVRG